MDETGHNAAQDLPSNTLQDDRETVETHQDERLLNAEGQSQPSESHIGDDTGLPQAVDGKDICDCSRESTISTGCAAISGQTQCPLCGKLKMEQSSETHLPSSLSGPSLLSPSETGQTFADGLPFTPSTAEVFHEGNNLSTSTSSENTTTQNDPPAVAEGRENNAVEGMMSPSTVQVPCRGRNFTFFTLVEDHPATNEKWFSTYFFPSQRYEDEPMETMEDFQRTFDFRNVVPCAREDDYTGLERSQHFHDIFMDGHAHLIINFQLLEQRPGDFEMRAVQIADRIPEILSLSQRRFPGATARVFVECLGAPGELCQAHIRMIVECEGKVIKVIIPIWDSPDARTLSSVICQLLSILNEEDIQDDPRARKAFQGLH